MPTNTYDIAWRGFYAPSGAKVSVPNCWLGRKDAGIIAIANHIMQSTIASCDAWFRSSGAQAAAHYGVGQLGQIYQWVRNEDSAWANGVVNTSPSSPTWLVNLNNQGRNINLFTISIEHEGETGEALTQAQYQASLWLHKQLIIQYKIPINHENIIGHYQVDIVNRPFCPGNAYPWSRLLTDLTNWQASNDNNVTPVTPPTPTPATDSLTLNGHLIGHGFYQRFMEIGNGDLTTAIRNVGLPLTDEFGGPDGVIRQAFEGLVFEYYPPDKFPDMPEFWRVTRARAGVDFMQAHPDLFGINHPPVSNLAVSFALADDKADAGRKGPVEDGLIANDIGKIAGLVLNELN